MPGAGLIFGATVVVAACGQAKGQGLTNFGGTWYVLNTAGNPVTAKVTSASGSSSGSSPTSGSGGGGGYGY